MTLRTWRRHFDRHVTTYPHGIKTVAAAYTCDDAAAWAALIALSDYKVNTIADGVVFLIPR